MGKIGIPLYGQNKDGGNLNTLADGVKVLRYKVTATTATVATHILHQFNKGDMILGWNMKVTTAVTSGGSATVLFGFTGGVHVSGAIAKATLVDNYCFGSEDKGAEVLDAADNFDITVGTAALTAGAFDIQIVYVPAPNITDGSDESGYETKVIG